MMTIKCFLEMKFRPGFANIEIKRMLSWNSSNWLSVRNAANQLLYDAFSRRWIFHGTTCRKFRSYTLTYSSFARSGSGIVCEHNMETTDWSPGIGTRFQSNFSSRYL